MRLSRRFLVDIDALFDTRIGWLKTIKPDAMEKLDLDVYRRRFTETWAEVVGVENWAETYAQRDKRALMNSGPTELLATLKNQFEAMLMEIEMHSPIEHPSVTVNLWPYTDLSDKEVQDFLDMFRAHFSGVRAEVVVWSHKDLTPGRLASAWDGWIMYDWYPWIKMQASNLAKRIPEFTITRPSLLTPELTPETIEFMQRDGVNPFKEHTRFMAEYVTVDCKDTALFSLRRPPKSASSESTPPA
ncbi:putative virion structural protein [Erwinia phage vB_EamM_Asesino]|uniref:Virion structural protein n=1 Tax=Erwinia phage vB_EamM_Asesino TaxID=1883370 RepID=A0A1B2IAK6_9CAUD|nr:putative virion structural protein [Erwinia phage vB_EamM_Asesino]ANZ48254.1 putative virion structural protein [Erwinia phage vB_EamM_Asesino]